MGENAKEMISAGMIGIARQRLAVQTLGFGEAAGLMTGSRRDEQGGCVVGRRRRAARRRARVIAALLGHRSSLLAIHISSKGRQQGAAPKRASRPGPATRLATFKMIRALDENDGQEARAGARGV